MSREISTKSSIAQQRFLGDFSVFGSVVVGVLVLQPSSCVRSFRFTYRFSGRQPCFACLHDRRSDGCRAGGTTAGGVANRAYCLASILNLLLIGSCRRDGAA